MQYEYFGPQGQRRSEMLADPLAEKRIGERVVIGFDVVHRHLEDVKGEPFTLVYFQSDITGKVWAVYHD